MLFISTTECTKLFTESYVLLYLVCAVRGWLHISLKHDRRTVTRISILSVTHSVSELSSHCLGFTMSMLLKGYCTLCCTLCQSFCSVWMLQTEFRCLPWQWQINIELNWIPMLETGDVSIANHTYSLRLWWAYGWNSTSFQQQRLSKSFFKLSKVFIKNWPRWNGSSECVIKGRTAQESSYRQTSQPVECLVP